MVTDVQGRRREKPFQIESTARGFLSLSLNLWYDEKALQLSSQVPSTIVRFVWQFSTSMAWILVAPYRLCLTDDLHAL